MKGAFIVYWGKLSKFKNIRIDTWYKTEIERFFQVIGDVILVHDQEFTENIVDATVFIKTYIRLYV